VPKKLLVYGAAYAEEFADARGFGWALPAAGAGAEGGPAHDWTSLMKLKVLGEGARGRGVVCVVCMGAVGFCAKCGQGRCWAVKGGSRGWTATCLLMCCRDCGTQPSSFMPASYLFVHAYTHKTPTPAGEGDHAPQHDVRQHPEERQRAADR
jgi:hypothetical protein